jgi:putative ABC transport system permease protein
MSLIREAAAITALNLRSIPARYGTSLVIVVGIAAVVAVLISVLAMATGFIETATRSGRSERAIVLGRGANSESSGVYPRNAATTILNAPGIRRNNEGKPIASAEHLAAILVPNSVTGRDAFIIVRGVGPEALLLRPEIRVVEGRMFKAGLNELIAGRSAQTRLGGLKVGDSVTLPQGDWKIVGVFESHGDSHESELLTDANTLIATMRRGEFFNSTTVWLENDGAFETFKNSVTTDPTLQVDVKREPEYFEELSRPVGRLLKIIAYVIGGFMALGAVFGALNTMYSAISARAVEIATLRAIGFGATPVVASVFAEALLLALIGSALGALVAWLFFNGSHVSTTTGTNPSQLTFTLNVTPALIASGVVCALIIGVLGGLFPALRAARRPVAMALRG